MPNHRTIRPFFGLASLLLLGAPAAAQSQDQLAARTLTVMNGLCGQASDATLATASCEFVTLPAAQQTQALLQVTPREQTAASSTATQTTYAQVEAEKGRLEKARREAKVDDERGFGVFLNGSGGWGDVEATGEADAYDVWGGGVKTGFDYRVTDELVAGLGFGWNRQMTESDTEAALSGSGASVGGGEIDSDSYTGSLYGGFFHGPLYVDGVFTYTYVDYEFERPIIVDLVNFTNSTANGDTRADQIGASVGGGYDFDLQGLALGPTLGVDYLQTWIDGYSESGVAGFPLDYDDQDITSLVTSLGAQASYPISTSFGVIVPHVREAGSTSSRTTRATSTRACS